MNTSIPYSDEQLIDGCKKGERKFQEFLYVKYGKLLMGICFRYLSDKMAAEDVFHETFIKVFQKIKSFQGGNLKNWLCRIFINASIDAYRENKRKYLHINYEDAGNVFGDEHLDIISKFSVEELMKIISSLPEGYKVVFNMFVIDGYSHKEISEILNISEGTSKSQLFKAKLMLANILQQMNITKYAIG